MPRLSLMERHIMQSSDCRDLFVERFEALVQQRMAGKTQAELAESPTNTRQQRFGLPRDTHELESVVRYNNIPVPVKIPTTIAAETVGDFSLISLIQTFSNPHTTSPQPFATLHAHLTTAGPLTHPVIVLLNALLTQKRVVFIGHNLPSSQVAETVLAACALASGGILRGFIRHAFPYTDLTKIDDLLKVPGFIAGVTNPTFSNHAEWWDLLCDLQTGRMTISPKIEQAAASEGVAFFQQPAAALQSAGLDGKGLGALASAGATLSAGLGGGVFPSSGGDATGDNAFMNSVLSAISERRGESSIRARFRLWVLKFTRLTAAFEEMVYGASALVISSPTLEQQDSPDSSPPLSSSGFSRAASITAGSIAGSHSKEDNAATKGHGYVWASQVDKIRELAANATRIEGWMKTRSYYNYIQDLAVYYSYRTVKDIDLQHLHDKLAQLRMGADPSGAIYIAICNAVVSDTQIDQLLVTLVNTSPSPGSGTTHSANAGGVAGGSGLFHIALGLFHPKSEVREKSADLLARVRDHEAGRHFWNKLGAFEKAAWERVDAARAEK